MVNWLNVILVSVLCIIWTTPGRADSDLAQEIFQDMPQPDKFSTLIENVSKKLEARYGVTFTAVIEGVDGRSLDEDHDSIKFPRNIVAFTANQNPQQQEAFVPLLIGFAPTAEQIEVIAMSSGGKGYDFHVIPGFKMQNIGKKMAIGASEKELCTTCHQGQGPIFSKFPWSETEGSDEEGVFNGRRQNGQSNIQEVFVDLKLLSSKKDQNGAQRAKLTINSFQPSSSDSEKLSDQEQKLKNFADPKRSSFGRPFTFDARIRSANRGAQVARACGTLCSSGTQAEQIRCRKGLFYLSARTSLLDQAPTEEDKTLLESLVPIWQKSWPKDNFAYASSVLPDRILKPGTDGETTFSASDSDDVYKQGNAASAMRSPLKIPGYRTNLKTPSGETYLHPGNPRFPRPEVEPLELSKSDNFNRDLEMMMNSNRGSSLNVLSALADLGLPYCFGLPKGLPTSDLRKESSNALYQALFAKSDMDSLFSSSDLPDGAKILAQLGAKDLTKTEGEFCHACLLNALLPDIMSSAKLGENLGVEALKTTSPSEVKKPLSAGTTQLATKICEGCHGEASRVKLPLDDAAALARYKDDEGQSVAERLRTGDMPPRKKRAKLAQRLGITEDQIASEVAELAAQLEGMGL